MSQYIIANPKCVNSENSKVIIDGVQYPEEVTDIEGTEWYLMDEDHDFYLRLGLQYWGARDGGRRAYPTFVAPKFQASGPLHKILPGGEFSKGLEPLHEAWERRDQPTVDIWDSCYQRNSRGDLVASGNGDYFHPSRETFVPTQRLCFSEKRMEVPNMFRRLAANMVLGFQDEDLDVYLKLRADARAQTIEYLQMRGIQVYDESLESALDDMECSKEKKVEVKLDTKGLAVHKFDFQFSSKELRSGALVLLGLANPEDEFNRVSVNFCSFNRNRMTQLFKKLGVSKQ